jgi:hypothetical protein
MKKNIPNPKTQKNEPQKSGYTRRIFLFLLVLLILFLLFMIFYSTLQNMRHKKVTPRIFTQEQVTQEEKWITIFTHGSFGSVLGLLNTMQVIHDNIAGTQYKKLINQMRKNPYFYKNQPILEKGLIKVESSFDPQTTPHKFAVYPISKAFEKISKLIAPRKEKNLFYTFGWSGLMSQTQRKKEAIRFYNALSDEIQKYKEQGINPKIRVIAHSHGGNISLNLAAVKTCLNHLENPEILEKMSQNPDDKESLLQMQKHLKALPTRTVAKNNKGQKIFDFLPENQNLQIDELIMLGTPIQPETQYLCLHDCFKKVYNLYSDEDVVQKIDWVSTKRYYSEQRINFPEKIKNKKALSKVVQVKIMIGRQVEPIINKGVSGLDNSWTLTLKAPSEKFLGLWDKVVSAAKGIFYKATQDPTHRELWFICWDQDDNFAHLPTVIFTPAILNVIENEVSAQNTDLDLNIAFNEKELSFYVCRHNKNKIERKISIVQETIEKIKNKIKKWKPEDLSYAKEFEIISNYSNNI